MGQANTNNNGELGGGGVGARKPPGLGQGARGKEQKHKGIKTKDQGTKGKNRDQKQGEGEL